MIELKNITKIYKQGSLQVEALKGLDLTIKDGEFLAIMGPSGSGKSTLLQILGLLDTPSSGSYLFNKKEVSHLQEDDLAKLRREEIGFVFQQFNLLPRLTALQNVALPLLYSQGAMSEEVPQECLKNVGMSHRTHHRPNELSGGQQQRVAISRALVNKPRMILADEPTGNLDSQSSEDIMKLLVDLNKQGITLVIVTHEDSISHYAHRVIRFKDGAILSDDKKNGLHLKEEKKLTEEASLKMASYLTQQWEHVRQSIRILSTNKVRTILSMLGILIGVSAVIAMLALGKGAQTAIENQFSSLGSNLIILRSGAFRAGGVSYGVGASTRLTLEDIKSIQEQIPTVKEAAPNVMGRAQVTYKHSNWNTQILGVSTAYPRMYSDTLTQGRFFTNSEAQQRSRVALIGRTVLKELFDDKNPIGEMIKINKVIFLVIGILPERGATAWQDKDDVIVIPVLTAMKRLFGKNYIDFIDIEAKSSQHLDEVEDSVRELMLSRHKIPLSQAQEAFQIRNMAEMRAALEESSRTLSLLLAIIAAISLFVGGIGIMNIMLVSVSERTREIGLRKAIGARRKDILFQFLVESLIIGVSGGFLGLLFGVVATYIISRSTGWTTSVSISSMFLSFLFSAAVGLIFGIYPARKASRLSPIEALRSE